jgi:hypothetical protein
MLSKNIGARQGESLSPADVPVAIEHASFILADYNE